MYYRRRDRNGEAIGRIIASRGANVLEEAWSGSVVPDKSLDEAGLDEAAENESRMEER